MAVLSVNQVDQLTHQVDDVTIDQLMTTPYSEMEHFTRTILNAKDVYQFLDLHSL